MTGEDRRPFGRESVELSPLTLGTMRLEERCAGDVSRAVRILELAWERGVTTLHTSSEYAGDAFFVAALAAWRAGKPRSLRWRFVEKIADPHFEDAPTFVASRFRTRIAKARERLSTETIDVVQWMVRSKPIQDPPRLEVLHAQASELRSSFEETIGSGAARSIGCFPYSPRFAKASLDALDIGLIDYLNLDERSAGASLDESPGFIALRPFAAGALTPPSDAVLARLRDIFELPMATREALSLAFVASHPHVSTVVASLSTEAHLDEAVEHLRRAPSRPRFNAALSLLHSDPTH